MNKAIFFDRDGVINNDEGLYYIYKIEDLKLNDGIVENIAMLSKLGFLIIIVSNQGGIAKGIYKKDDVEKINNIIIKKVQEKGGQIAEIYYCPHHEEIMHCLCRKPSPLLIEKAIARFNIDKNKSWFIGDSNRDIEAAKNAGIKGILVPKNTNIYDICKKIIEQDLEE